MKNKKLVSSVIAVALAAGILLGGTFAWQSISQQALNEVYGFVNPGGRLHDDFNEVTNPAVDTTRQFDKNVYVENFTSLVEDGVQVFARIRLDEYMEIGPGAGTNDADKGATSLVPGSVFDQKNTWKTHIPNETDPFHAYWNWTMGGDNGSAGSTVYMPTFNKNKDSLQADVNGTFAGANGVPFDDYKPYAENETKEAAAYYDKDENTTDEIYPIGTSTVENALAAGYIRKETETHTAKKTEEGSVITMAEWLARDEADRVGNFWVWDVDGWAYWAKPINPDTATGLFLDGIARTTEIINEDWYYGINVVAQFVTADDLGRPAPGETGTGFYDDKDGSVPPSTNALKLLAAIGVDVNTTVTVGSDPAAAAVELSKALDLGGNVTISGTVNGDTTVTPWESAPQWTSEYMMANGGTLNGGTVTVDGDKVFGLVVEAGATSNSTSVLNNVDLAGNSEAVLYVGENGGHVTLNGVNVTADGGAGIYAEFAQGGVTLNNCTVNQYNISAGHDAWFQTAVAAAQGADIVINGGTYTSNGWAVYCFEGANLDASTVTINDGTFSGKLQANNNDKIIIKGGTFSNTGITKAAEFAKFVADGYKAVYDDVADTWTVTIA